MKITIGIEDDEWEAIPWMGTICEILNDECEGQNELLCAAEEIKFFLERVYEVTDNKRIIKKDKLLKKEIKKAKLPSRKVVLTCEGKAGMTDEEIFAAEYGLRASFGLSTYWRWLFEETYRHTPSLPDCGWKPGGQEDTV